MRQYLRYPADVPILLSADPLRRDALNSELDFKGDMLDVCQGGVSLQSSSAVSVGSHVCLTIASVSPTYRGCGKVMWCKKTVNGFDVGISFLDQEEAFRSRMVQQICQIELYKQRVFELEGRLLDGEQAASEWIEKHASYF